MSHVIKIDYPVVSVPLVEEGLDGINFGSVHYTHPVLKINELYNEKTKRVFLPNPISLQDYTGMNNIILLFPLLMPD